MCVPKRNCIYKSHPSFVLPELVNCFRYLYPSLFEEESLRASSAVAGIFARGDTPEVLGTLRTTLESTEDGHLYQQLQPPAVGVLLPRHTTRQHESAGNAERRSREFELL